MSYNPENDVPASPGELRSVYDVWQRWLYQTGTLAGNNDQAPLGFDVPAGKTILDPESVPIRPRPLLFRRYFSSSQAEEVHFFVPRAATVLGLGDRFSVIYRPAYLPAKDLQSPPEEYVPSACMLTIPSPSLSDLSARSYRLVAARAIGGDVAGSRYDRLVGKEDFVVGDNGMPPRIMAIELDVLNHVGQACMTFFASERATASRPEG